MKVALQRLATLFVLFCLALIAVALWMRWQDHRGLPGFLRAQKEAFAEQKKSSFRPESYTLQDFPAIEEDAVALLARLNAETTALVNSVVPAVVSIDTVGQSREQLNYFGRRLERTRQTSGVGSGVIVTREGHVVTNEHVIDNSLGIRVTLHDGTSLPARLVGQDEALDVAVLRIEAEGPFPALPFGNSDEVKPGERIYAIGNPFGLGETVTQGIVSAREQSLSDRQRDLFQIDAAINPGNSGGPLINLRGEVVGINVAIYANEARERAYGGVGFSIPAADVRESFVQIVERGSPLRGFLGLNGRKLSAQARYELGYPGEFGVAIETVFPGSPAEKAGLRRNDVIVKYAGEGIHSLTQLIALIQDSKVGEVVELELWSRAGRRKVTPKIVDYDAWQQANSKQAKEAPLADDRAVLKRLGIFLRDLSVLERTRGEQGVLVEAVLPGSASAKANLRKGDLVLEINDRRTTDAGDLLARLTAGATIQETRLEFRRGEQILQAVIPKLTLE